MIRLCLALYCLVLLSGCSFFRTDTTSDSEKNVNTVRKQTTVTDTVMPDGSIRPLQQIVYEEVTSKEVARAEQSTNTSSDLASVATGMLGMGPLADMLASGGGVIASLLAAKKGVSVYNSVRDAPPRPATPAPAPAPKGRSREDERA